MGTLIDIVSQTLRTLWAHKLRSFLTMFGIAWGVASLLLLVGLGKGFETGNQKQLRTIGENVIFIWPGRAPAVQGNANSGRWYNLTVRDYQDIVNESRHVLAATPVLNRGDIRAVSEYANVTGVIVGVMTQFNKIRFMPLAQGRWFNSDDMEQQRLVMVISDPMRRNLFPGRPALGETVLLNGMSFKIIGVLQVIGRENNNNNVGRAFVPFPTMAKFFPYKGENVPYDAIGFINFSPKSREEHEEAVSDAKKIIARNHGFDPNDPDAFNYWDTVKSADTVALIFRAMNIFLGSVGMVTLALGAIGIINIMLVSVSERTKEIGLRKAIGATRRSILVQFFMEGVFLTVLSGSIGIGAASALCFGLSFLPSPPGWDPPTIVPSTAIMAVAALGAAGLVAGMYPARRASLLEPVEALRKE